MGKDFQGVYHLLQDEFHLYQHGQNDKVQTGRVIPHLLNEALDEQLGDGAKQLREEIDLVMGASYPFDSDAYLSGKLTPVFFGSAMNNFGVKELLDTFVQYAPETQPRETTTRIVEPQEPTFTGFVFKIQANMDPAHRDRIAFLRICSGSYQKGMKIRHVRLKRDIQVHNALTFMAGEREHVEEAFPGDIIGLHNHGTIQIGDTFTQGEELQFIGIPYFAPEIFRRVRLRDPLKLKALQKGLLQLSEEGATQFFRPLTSNELILGAIGVLQFDVVAYRLKNEYNVECKYENATISTARWIASDNKKKLDEFKQHLGHNLALDVSNNLTYLAPSMINLNLTQERWPDIEFRQTREMVG